MTNRIHNFEINHLINGYDGEVVTMINSAGACARVHEFHTNYRKGTSNEQLIIDYVWIPVYDCGQAIYLTSADY